MACTPTPRRFVRRCTCSQGPSSVPLPNPCSAAGAVTHRTFVLQDAPDIVLETSCGFQVQLFKVVTAGRGRRFEYAVPLAESAAEWRDSRTRRRVLRVDFLAAITHLRAIKLRGGFFSGAERTQLGAVRISPPSNDDLRRVDLVLPSPMHPCRVMFLVHPSISAHAELTVPVVRLARVVP